MRAWPADRPLILGHRGTRQEAPENTIPAFRYALAVGADGVELDVRLTADGQAVVMHDASLERTTDGRGLLAQTTLAELRELDAGRWFGPAFAGTPPCTLGEALEVLAPARLVNIELKGSLWSERGLERAVLEVVHEQGRQEQVILSCFSPIPLLRLRRMDPQIALAWLHGPGLSGRLGLLLARLLRLQALHPFYRVLSPAYLRQAHRRGLRVLTWTVNQEADFRRLAAWGVDGLVSDRPAEAVRWLTSPS